MAIKVKHETIAKIGEMGQKEALRKYAAGEGDDEFKEAITRYYSKRRIEAAKKEHGAAPKSEVMGTRQEAPAASTTATTKKEHAAAAERRLQGTVSSQRAGVTKEAMAKKSTGAIQITSAGRAAEAKRNKAKGRLATLAGISISKSSAKAPPKASNAFAPSVKKGPSKAEQDYKRLYAK